jgi:ribonuclease P protein component
MSEGRPPDHRFPRRYRLTRPSEFERALRGASLRIQRGTLRISAVRNRMHTARLGLVVGKKAVAKAHERNRLKRVVRDCFRRERSNLPSLDIVVRVVAPATDQEVRSALDDLFAELEKDTLEHSPDA